MAESEGRLRMLREGMSQLVRSPSATSSLPKQKIDIMLPRTTSMWQRDPQPTAPADPWRLTPCRCEDPAWTASYFDPVEGADALANSG